MDEKQQNTVSSQQVMEELVAIGFAKATDFLSVEEDALVVKSTSQWPKETAAAIASVERTSAGIKLKFYDKLKALELLGKQMGLFDGKPEGAKCKNNLLEAIVAATGEEVVTDDIPELQQAPDSGDDLVEPAKPDG